MRYNIKYTSSFQRQYKRLVRKHHSLVKPSIEVINQLHADPFQHSLRTHKVGEDPDLGTEWSSRVTTDIRIVWAFGLIEEEIVLLRIGDHDHVY